MARVRLSVAQRREELLRAAIGQIEERGVSAVRISDVANALGVSNALVLYHFATKEKLVAAAFTYAAEADLARPRPAAQAAGPPDDRAAPAAGRRPLVRADRAGQGLAAVDRGLGGGAARARAAGGHP